MSLKSKNIKNTNDTITTEVKEIQIKIWDFPTRIFHFLLVILFGFLWFSGETGKYPELHMKAGMMVLSLIIFRLLWGFLGSTSSRFSRFFSPFAALKHGAELLNRNRDYQASHNPLGGIMVIVMLIIIALQATTGLFSSDLILTEGPLFHLVDEETSEQMTDYHYLGFTILLYLVCIHVFAIFFYKIYKRTPLIKSMITGKKAWPIEKAQPTILFVSPFYALLLFLLSILIVFGGISYLSAL